MGKKSVMFLLVFSLVLSLMPSTFLYAVEAGGTAKNPVMWADVPDVSIIRVGDTYYMSSTTMHMNPGVPIMKSKNLVDWEIVNYVYDVLGGNDKQALLNGEDEYSKGSWASSLRYHEGYFYVAFASYSTGGTFIFKTADIENGPWERTGVLDGVYHDMSLFFDDDGRVYLFHGSGDIKLIELKADLTGIKSGGINQVVIKEAWKAAEDAGFPINGGLQAEGTQVRKINGKYYVFNIIWPAGQGRMVICHRADSLLGSYEGKVVLNDQGIAQGGLIDTPNGDWYAMLFGDRGAVGRIPYLVPVTWEDDWPVLGVDGKVPQDTGILDADLNLKIVQSDEFNNRAEKIGAYHTVIDSTSTPEVVQPELTPLDPSEGIELIENGGFENGLESWSGHGGASLAISDEVYNNGEYSVLVTTRAAIDFGPQQYLTGKLKAGHIYHFSANIRYDDPLAPDTKTFNMNFKDGDWRTIKVMGSGRISRGQWGTIEGTYTVPSDITLNEPLIFIETPWVAEPDPNEDLMDFYVDDISFVDITPSDSILINSGFENGQEPWQTHERATLSVTNEQSYSGRHSLKITERGTTGSGPQQSLKGKVKPGRKYQFSAKVRYDNAESPDTRQFIMSFQDGNWQTIKNMGSGRITKGQWGTIEGTYTIPSDAILNEPLIFIETSWTQQQDRDKDLMDFYVDDVTLVDVTPTDIANLGENDYNGSNLGLVWQWNHNPDNRNWSLTERNGYLRLTTGRISSSILDAKNTLSQRTFGPESSANIAIDVSNMKDGDYAGLAAFQYYYGFVGVKMSDGIKSIVMVKGSSNNPNQESSPEEIENIPIEQDKIYLKVECDFKNRTDKAYFYYSLDGVKWESIGDTLQMSYTLPHFMGYRFALFNFATKRTGGYVDFDYFRIDDKITGINEAGNVLSASLGNASIMGVYNAEVQIPVKMDPLPEGEYTSIAASFTIPGYLTVTDVDFNIANIIGTPSYTYNGSQLLLNVAATDGNVSFINNESDDLFATIKLKVNEFVPVDIIEKLTTDYIKVEGGDVVYKVNDAVANIELKALKTDAIAKIPGYSNPLRDYKLGADPYAIVYDGRVYLYMSSDEFVYDSNGKIKENSFSMLNRVFVMSSDDMVNWTDHGEIPVAGRDGMNNGEGIAKWAVGSWAPAAAHKVIDGKDKFFLYFSNAAGGIGVLTADTPIGPWTDPRGEALIRPGDPGVVWLFDPAVLVDDDGTGYLYYGGGIPGGNNPTQENFANPKSVRVVQLSDDMIHTVGDPVVIDAPFVFENSGIHKYNGKYYYSYCSNFGGSHPENNPPGEIVYMTSDSPMGPFKYRGSILKNPQHFFGVGGNNHHTVFEFNNQWYIVYHAQTVSKAILGDGKGYRSPHINKVEYYENGLMKPIRGDMEGISQLINLDPYKRIEAETIAWNAGITTEKCKASGNPVESINLNITNIDNGDWIAVSNVDFGANGAKSFKANVAATVGGKIEIRLDSPQGDLIGTLDIKPTGGEQQWEEKQCDIDIEKAKGIHSIFFVFTGSNDSNLFNMDYWQFTRTPNTIAATGVTLDANTLSLTQGNSAQITATVAPENATINTVTWSSNNPTVATVDSLGKVTAKAAGTAIITATTVDGGFTAICAVTVELGETPGVEVTGVSLDKNTATLRVNKNIQLIATIAPANATNKGVTWSSSDETVATVDQTGKVTGIKAGTAIITVTTIDGNFTAECAMIVEKQSSSGGSDSSGDSSSGGSSGSGSGGGSTTKPKQETKAETKTETKTETSKTDENVNNETPSQVKPVKVSISLSKGTASGASGDLKLDVKPYIQDGRTMVGVRDIATLINVEGKNIIWDAKSKKVFIKANGKEIEFTIGQKYVLVNGKKVELDVAPQIKDGRTVLPIAHLARILGMEVEFIPETKEVILSVKK